MTTDAVIAQLERCRILPVIVIDDADYAPALIAALAAGGIHCAEITLRTEAGLPAITTAAQSPGSLIGAGTVLTADQVDASVDAGAQFIVSPGFDDEVVERALERGVAVIPGVATATDVQRAVRAGLSVVKFFPADRLGGLGTIAALSAAFAGMRFLPSGGVGPTNLVEYLEHPSVFAVSGSWMASRDTISAGDFDAIRRSSADAMRLAGSRA